MKACCDIIIEFENLSKGRQIMDSVEVDNFDFVKSKLDGKKLKAYIEAENVSSLLHTLDDYLACLSVAEKIVDKK